MPRKADAPLPHPADIKRINVAVNPDIVRAIQNVMTREHVNLTEAVRRLVGYGDFVYRTIRDEGYEMKLEKEGQVKDVVLLR